MEACGGVCRSAEVRGEEEREEGRRSRQEGGRSGKTGGGFSADLGGEGRPSVETLAPIVVL